MSKKEFEMIGTELMVLPERGALIDNRQTADQIEQSIESLVAEFKSCNKLAGRQLIQGYAAVSRAKAKGKNGFEDFCDGAQLDPKSSKTRKYVIIGNNADWLLPIVDKLPADNWTTIYDVVVLGQVRAEEMARLGTLHPQITAEELKAAAIAEGSERGADATKEAATTAEQCVLQVDASDISDEDRLNLFHKLEEAAARHGLAVTGLPDRLAEKLIIEREAA
jgi:hypothetical protein